MYIYDDRVNLIPFFHDLLSNALIPSGNGISDMGAHAKGSRKVNKTSEIGTLTLGSKISPFRHTVCKHVYKQPGF